jgi:hydroxymethylglutaryl-CoA reductase (NADPH)
MPGQTEAKQKPQPKWAVLQTMNYVVTAIFVGSIAYIAVFYKNSLTQKTESISPLTNSFFPIMVLWCACLAYFFGFFGISFLDKEVLASSPSTFGLDDMRRQAEDFEQATHDENTRKAAPITSIQKQSATTATTKHIPRNDTPICAERVSVKSSDAVLPATNVDIDDIDFENLADEEVLGHLISGSLKDYQLEKKLGDYERAVGLRRALYEHLLEKDLALIPYTGFDYGKVFGANCEIVIGYVPIPVGVVGPLTINGEPIYIPMATTEGCLVASTNRGCKAISVSGGCCSVVLKDAITRAPCIRMPSAMRAAAVKRWVSQPENYAVLEEAFNSTTSFGKLHSVEGTVAGRNVYLRFCCMSGDAMGMNMVSKGCLKAIEVLEGEFPDLVLVAISGNMCTDKKPAAINWILGRGKSIVVEAIISESVVKSVLKSSVHDMIETNKQKNHIGSAMAGSVGGFNAHAANIVTAVFLATGQDPAQNVESSNCLTIMEYAEDGKSLHVSCTMPSIEVGTVGGGTHLPAQAGCLDICGVRGAAKGPGAVAGDNSRKLAQIVGAAVLAGELSLMAALAANHLVRSHMQHNRKPATEVTAAPAVTGVKAMSKCASMPDLKQAKA